MTTSEEGAPMTMAELCDELRTAWHPRSATKAAALLAAYAKLPRTVPDADGNDMCAGCGRYASHRNGCPVAALERTMKDVGVVP